MNPRMDPVSVLVVSPDPLARSGLAALVAGIPGLELAGEAGPLDAARVEAGRAPGVILWDVGGADRSGMAGSRWAELAAPVVALAVDAEQAGDALRAGARSVISRSAAPEAVAAAVACAAMGLAVLDPALAGSYLRVPDPPDGGEPLTPREREVLALLAEGLANKAIAARLGISEHTAKFHVNAILAKLGVDSRAEAIVRAARLGLVVL
jgi:two-component system nitrate/nitrite response regulator NarL